MRRDLCPRLFKDDILRRGVSAVWALYGKSGGSLARTFSEGPSTRLSPTVRVKSGVLLSGIRSWHEGAFLIPFLFTQLLGLHPSAPRRAFPCAFSKDEGAAFPS
ncbi:hypothetical protein B4135_3838 [Caldibacillus debilis]|uniref:Uncharacterized protein n=1 Tax=Caldibacillus debilis TaxID=301148 RepID=A0A150L9E1_9BACI|nr:hypothetical protein B4135_3838 [Caldibacillus debilis]